MLAWGALSALRKTSEPEIRVAILLQTPMAAQGTPPKPIASAPMPIKTPVISRPLETPKVLPKTPTPTVVIAAKPIAVPVAVPTAAPTVVKTPATEPVIVKAPLPPVNVQAEYEEENLGRIRTLLAERLKYPKNALRLKQQGDVLITFTLSPSGGVSAIAIAKSSDFGMLDDAARTLIESTAPLFPKPSKNIRISLPIEYKIR